jgi:alpha-amylase
MIPTRLLAMPLLLTLACASPQQGRAPALPTTPCRAAVQAPKWWHDAVGYEVFVRSFADSDGDGIGDLPGLLAHLDYLNDGKPGGSDLGVDVLWLMPVTPSPSYHGYDVTEYRGVNPQYGTLADLDAVVKAAHQRGMKVVLDLVLNHTSSQHPWFLDSAAQTGHGTWYPWRGDDPGWKQPFGSSKTWHKLGNRYYYGVFYSGMPDLDFTIPAVRAEMVDVGQFWLARGLDGFRLDAVRYLIETGPGAGQQDTTETIAYWQQFSAAMGPQALLVGEAWAANATAAKYHAGGTGLGMTFDFDAAAALLASVQAGEPGKLQQVLCAEDAWFPAGSARGTFLTNHDMVRTATQLQGNPLDLRLAAALLLTIPGTPWLYYGEELGMTNGPGSDDLDKRTPMQWNGSPGGGFTSGTPWQPLNGDSGTVHVAAQTADPGSLLALYRRLIAARKAHPALRTGALELVADRVDGTDVVAGAPWAFVRTQGGDRVLCLFNLGDAPVVGSTPAGTDVLDGTHVAAGSVNLQPRSFRLVALD